MLRFFRFNDPYRLLFVLLVTLALGIKSELEFQGLTKPELREMAVGEMLADGKRQYTSVWDSLPPLAAYSQKALYQLFERGTMSRHVMTWFLIFFQAAYFSIVLVRNKAFNESNYLPALLLAVMAFFSFDSATFTQEILGSSCLLLALNNLFEEIEFKKQRDENIHNLGLYLSLAGLCVFSYIFFLLTAILLLIVYTRMELRRFLLLIIGFTLPHAALITYYIWHGELNFLWQNFYWANMNWHVKSWISTKSLWVLLALPLMYLLSSLIMARRDARLTKYQSQIFQVMLFWLITGAVQVALSQQRTPQSLLVCLPPTAYFINHYILLINRKWLAEAMLWMLLIGVLVVATLGARNKMGAVDYTSLIAHQTHNNITGKKLLVLADDPGLWLHNKPAGVFLEWRLAESVMQQPNYYQHVLAVAANFQQDPPEIIYDPKNFMAVYMRYLPEFALTYTRQGDWWQRR